MIVPKACQNYLLRQMLVNMCEWYRSSAFDLPPSSSLHKALCNSFTFSSRFYEVTLWTDEPYKTHFIPCIVVIFCIPFEVPHLKSYWNHDLTDVSWPSLMMDSKNKKKNKKEYRYSKYKNNVLQLWCYF